MTWLEAVRWGNAILSLAACFLMGMNLTRRWDVITPRLRRLNVSFGALLGATAYASWESARQHLPFGWRVILVGIAVIAVVVSLMWGHDENPTK